MSTISSAAISPEQLSAALALRDLTDPLAGPHALQELVSCLESAVAGGWGATLRRSPGDRVVPVTDNYDRLRYDSGDVTRASRYTRYVGEGLMLRSHMSARIPALLDDLPPEEGPILLSAPGICYRRDVLDRSHVGEPHQMDLWLVRLDGPALTSHDLERMVGLVVQAVLPGCAWRTPPSLHPYTLEGREVYVEVDGVELEIGECGLAHPEVLAGSGLPASASGLAMGLGLDRLLMLRKGIPDIRLLRSGDPRVASQMLDLERYRPVSSHPPVKRDLSLLVSEDVDEELLGDLIRDALGAAAEGLEEVLVLSETPYAALPDSARVRMGARPGLKNVLLRLWVRSLERTLTSGEANDLRDLVYARLHEGDAGEWESA